MGRWRAFIADTNWVFIAIYSVEIVLKLVAYSYYFFYDAWNNFDFIVVISSIVDSTASGNFFFFFITSPEASASSLLLSHGLFFVFITLKPRDE